jgi:hypothetical protein
MDSNYAVIKDGILQKFITTLTENMYYDQNGYLVCTDAVLGRTGSQEYTKRELGIDNSNDIIEVYRLEEYVFDEDSMKSLEGRPLTLKHPKSLVTIENHQELAKGEVFNVRREGNTIIGDIRVTDEKVAKLIVDKKMRELSLGYIQDLKYDEEKDIYYFTNIIYNHIALVKRGRAGIAIIKDEELEEVERENEKMDNKKIAEMLSELAEKILSLEEEPKEEKEEKVEVEEKVEDKEEEKKEEKVEEVEKEEKLEDACKDQKVVDSKEIVNAIKELTKSIKDNKEEQPETLKVEVNDSEEKEVVDHDVEMQKYFYQLQKTPFETEKEYMARLRKDDLVNYKSTVRVYNETR